MGLIERRRFLCYLSTHEYWVIEFLKHNETWERKQYLYFVYSHTHKKHRAVECFQPNETLGLSSVTSWFQMNKNGLVNFISFPT